MGKTRQLLLLYLVFFVCAFSCAGKDVDIAFTGDSITADGQWVRTLQMLEALEYPGAARIFYNRGVSGGSVADALKRIESDILQNDPGIVAVLFGMNDIGRNDYRKDSAPAIIERRARNLARYRENLTTLVDTLLVEKRKVILLTPTPFDEYSESGKQYSGLNENGLSAAAEIVRQLAVERKCELIDLHSKMTMLLKKNPNARLCGSDNIHPKEIGNLCIALLIHKALHGTPARMETTVDAAKASENGIFSFEHRSNHLPYPHGEDSRQLIAMYPVENDLFSSDILHITGLKEGDWSLSSEWSGLGTFSSAELAKGVNLDELNIPLQRQSLKVLQEAEKLRVVDRRQRSIAYGYEVLARRNLQFADDKEALALFDDFANKSNSAYHKAMAAEFRKNLPLQEHLEKELLVIRDQMHAAARIEPYKLTLRRVEKTKEASIVPGQTVFLFEGEEIVDPEDSNRAYWRGWTEKGAAWGSLGTLLRGPRGDAEREPLAKESTPVRLKVELPKGKYSVSARGGRTVGLSFDGGINFLRATFPGNREIRLFDDWSFPGGTCTVILSNCHAEKAVAQRGFVYLDYLKFERTSSFFGNKPVTLDAVTNRPFTGLFIAGETPEITFTLQNLTQEDKGLSLKIRVTNEHGAPLVAENFSVSPDQDGQWQKTWRPPAEKKGFYRVFADFGGITLPGVGTKPSGFLTYGIVFDPAERRLYPREQTFFGMQGRFFGETINAIPLLGIRWVRGPAQWGVVDRERFGQFAEAYCKAQSQQKKFPDDPRPSVTVGKEKRPWTTYFYCTGVGANNCHPEKWDIPACVSYSPSWGTIGPWGVLTEKGKKGFALYMETLAKSVSHNYPEDPERIYEVLWEPTAYYSGTPEDLVEYLRIAQESLRKFAPRARIAAPTLDRLSYESTIFGSPTAGKDNFLEYTKKLFRAGMGKYLDVYSIHPYAHSHRPPEETRMAEALRELKKLLRNETGRNIPIIGTEHGYASSDFASELRNARYIIRGNLILLGEGVLFNIAFYPCFSHTDGSDFGFFYCTEPKGRTVISPRPQAIAYAAMTRLLEGFRPTETLDLPGSARGYAYENGEEVVLALWDYNEQGCELKFPAGGNISKLFDWMGNELSIKPKDGFFSLKLGPEVIYLTNVDPVYFGKHAKRTKISFETPRLRLFPGGKGELDVVVKAPASEKISARITAEAEKVVLHTSASAITIPPGGNSTFRVEVAVPYDTPSGTQRLTLKVQDTETKKNIVLSEYELEVLPSVEFLRVEPVFEPSGQTALRVLLEEKSGNSLTTDVTLRIDGEAYRSLAFLSPREKKSIIIPLGKFNPESKEKYSLSLTASVNGVTKGMQETTVNFTRAVYFSEGALKNFSLRKWHQIPAIRLDKSDCIRNATIYSGDTTALFFGWNHEALFLRAEVRDNVILQEQKEIWNLWRDDCLQWGICLEPWKQRISSGNTLIDNASTPRQVEFVLASLSGHPVVCCSLERPEQKERQRRLLTPEEFQLTLRKEGDILIYEAAVPWKTLGLEKAPEYLGTTVAVNDRDSRSSGLSALSLFAGACVEKFPELMGILTLTTNNTAIERN